MLLKVFVKQLVKGGADIQFVQLSVIPTGIDPI